MVASTDRNTPRTGQEADRSARLYRRRIAWLYLAAASFLIHVSLYYLPAELWPMAVRIFARTLATIEDAATIAIVSRVLWAMRP